MSIVNHEVFAHKRALHAYARGDLVGAIKAYDKAGDQMLVMLAFEVSREARRLKRQQARRRPDEAPLWNAERIELAAADQDLPQLRRVAEGEYETWRRIRTRRQRLIATSLYRVLAGTEAAAMLDACPPKAGREPLVRLARRPMDGTCDAYFNER